MHALFSTTLFFVEIFKSFVKIYSAARCFFYILLYLRRGTEQARHAA